MNALDSRLLLDDFKLQVNWPGCLEAKDVVFARGISMEGVEYAENALGASSAATDSRGVISGVFRGSPGISRCKACSWAFLNMSSSSPYGKWNLEFPETLWRKRKVPPGLNSGAEKVQSGP